MFETRSVDRRRFLAGAAGAAALLGGCDRLAQSDTTKNVLASAETLTSDVQHLISPEQVLAPEYTEADLSRYFKPNGTADPDNDDYQEMAAKGFADWTLEVGVWSSGRRNLRSRSCAPCRRGRRLPATTASRAGVALGSGRAWYSARCLSAWVCRRVRAI